MSEENENKVQFKIGKEKTPSGMGVVKIIIETQGESLGAGVTPDVAYKLGELLIDAAKEVALEEKEAGIIH